MIIYFVHIILYAQKNFSQKKFFLIQNMCVYAHEYVLNLILMLLSLEHSKWATTCPRLNICIIWLLHMCDFSCSYLCFFCFFVKRGKKYLECYWWIIICLWKRPGFTYKFEFEKLEGATKWNKNGNISSNQNSKMIWNDLVKTIKWNPFMWYCDKVWFLLHKFINIFSILC